MANLSPDTGGSDQPDSRYAWWRLLIALGLATIGGIGLWSVVVALPAIEAEFGVDRGSASIPYFATMIGFAIGGGMMGRLTAELGVQAPVILGSISIALGYVLASQATSMWQFILAQALLIGMFGSSATFGPLVADITLWFVRRRGIAVAIVASGNYLAGTIWPPLLQFAIDTFGWRAAHIGIGIFCLVTMLPLALALRKRTVSDEMGITASSRVLLAKIQMSPSKIQALIVIAGFACCMAMAMPQVHIVAYCGDLGYGVARGAEVLSLMLGFGIVSRLLSGWIADRIGGLRTLLLGSSLQCLASLFYIPFDGLTSLYVVSAMFGLSQGGIVPSYALIVREYFPAREAGARVSLILMVTIAGMAVGGWMSGEIYDLTGSYQMAFLNGIAWNLLNMSIAFWLLAGRSKATPAAV